MRKIAVSAPFKKGDIVIRKPQSNGYPSIVTKVGRNGAVETMQLGKDGYGRTHTHPDDPSFQGHLWDPTAMHSAFVPTFLESYKAVTGKDYTPPAGITLYKVHLPSDHENRDDVNQMIFARSVEEVREPWEKSGWDITNLKVEEA